MPYSKVIFIGLPGAGKTSAAQMLAQKHNLKLYSSDVIIKEILIAFTANSSELPRIYQAQLIGLQKAFIKRGLNKTLVLKAFQCDGFEKHSSAFMALLGESYWREVEATIAATLINENPEWMFDLGASQILNKKVMKAINDNTFYLIYLDNDPAAIEQHLLTPQSNGKARWETISNYAKEGSDGWQRLALEHRRDRAGHYAKNANFTIKVVTDSQLTQIVSEAEKNIADKDLETQSYLRIGC